ncbi:hypothetical protein SFRURICE_015708 [Spodoptera frugiperda]|nr:hypothetical protein SFRURICE_015708 [Spodoptera frugiperda]
MTYHLWCDPLQYNSLHFHKINIVSSPVSAEGRGGPRAEEQAATGEAGQQAEVAVVSESRLRRLARVGPPEPRSAGAVTETMLACMLHACLHAACLLACCMLACMLHACLHAACLLACCMLHAYLQLRLVGRLRRPASAAAVSESRLRRLACVGPPEPRSAGAVTETMLACMLHACLHAACLLACCLLACMLHACLHAACLLTCCMLTCMLHAACCMLHAACLLACLLACLHAAYLRDR